MTLQERVKGLLQERGISARALETELGFGNGYISKLDKSMPNSRKLSLIADYFGVSTDFLLYGDENAEDNNTFGKLPVLGFVRAGSPTTEYENVIDFIKTEYSRDDGYFALMVKGDSMQPRLFEGDIVIVKAQADAENGEIVVAQINGDEACVKKLIKFAHGIALQSLNPAYPLLQFSEEQMHEIPVIILGKVVEARARF